MAGQQSTYRLGVDVGGTFTDFVLVNEATGAIHLDKRLTTPQDPSIAVMEGINYLLREQATEGGALSIVVHGTTLVVNAIIERKGARVMLFTTQGIRDVLHIGNENRYDINDRNLTRPAPLVPREQIYQVAERLQANGTVIQPLDPENVRTLIDQLNGIDDENSAIAISLLHAYRYPDHEQQLKSLIREKYPQLPISLSSEVAPEIREFPRTSTTVANAYVQPLVSRYLGGLVRQLQEIGYKRNLYLMLSDGGVTTAATASSFPIRLVESGAAGGALAATNFARLIDQEHILGFDMGGTTAKMCVIDAQQPKRTNAMEVARINRFKKGSGLPLLLPVIELLEIGAGGGSIARVDNMGLIKVGPQSAGAMPGPASYGRGGTQPTVTDAAVVLGYLNPEYFLGGRMPLDKAKAEQSIRTVIAEPLGSDVVSAANGIYEISTQNMADAMRVYLAELGKDARDYTLVAFGGGGPVHACRMARSLKIPRVLIPLGAGATSALGFLTAPMAFEFTRTYISELGDLNAAQLETIFVEMLETSLAVLNDAGVAAEAAVYSRWADMRYRVQTHEIQVQLPLEFTGSDIRRDLHERFERQYHELFGYTLENREIEITGCRLRAQGPTPKPIAPRLEAQRAYTSALKQKRPVYFAEQGGFAECAVYDRYALAPSIELQGPAIIEEADSTTVVDPATDVTVDEFLNLRLELRQ